MSLTVTPILANPDPNANPTSVQELVTLLNSLFETVNVGNAPVVPYVVGVEAVGFPPVGDNDKVWIQVDGNGRPVAIKRFYNGAWRKIYTGRSGQIAIFSGNPATYFSAGLGIASATEPNWDGWAICDGTNGTPDLRDKFIISANSYDAGGAKWISKVEDGVTAKQSGGAVSILLKNTDLPHLDVVIKGMNTGTGGTGDRVLVDGTHGTRESVDNTIQVTMGPAIGVAQTQPVTVPPYYALAYVMFVGY